MLERVWRKENLFALSAGMSIDIATTVNIMEIPLKTKNRTTIRPSNPTPGYIPWKKKHIILKDTCTPMFTAALFTIGRMFYCSVAQSMSYSLWPHGLQHVRLLCPSLSPRVCSDSSIESMMPFNHLILCHPLLLLPSIFPSIGVFSSDSALHIRWPKYWSFSFSIRPSNEYSGLISFRIEWFDLVWLVWSGLTGCPRDSQESSPEPQPGHGSNLNIWVKKMWYIYTMEYNLAIKGTKLGYYRDEDGRWVYRTEWTKSERGK